MVTLYRSTVIFIACNSCNILTVFIKFCDAHCLAHGGISIISNQFHIAITCFITGAGTVEVYEREGVRASVGVSGVSVKQTVAFLAPCALVALYLTRGRHRWIALAAAMALLTSTLLSFERAVQVGLAAAALWLAVWFFALNHRFPRPGHSHHFQKRAFVEETGPHSPRGVGVLD